MKYAVCAVKDRAVDAFNRPIYVPTIGVAIRSFTDEVNRKDSEASAVAPLIKSLLFIFLKFMLFSITFHP